MLKNKDHKLSYEDYKDKVGTKYTITEGRLVEDPEGEFTCSRSFSRGSIYINDFTVYLIPIGYLGFEYKLRQTDCVSLCADWLRDNRGFDLVEHYKKYDKDKFLEYYHNGMVSFFQDNPDQFSQISDFEQLAEGDVVVYSYDGRAVSHIGIYLEGNKILHHLPRGLSCVDLIDTTKILGAFRVL